MNASHIILAAALVTAPGAVLAETAPSSATQAVAAACPSRPAELQRARWALARRLESAQAHAQLMRQVRQMLHDDLKPPVSIGVAGADKTVLPSGGPRGAVSP